MPNLPVLPTWDSLHPLIIHFPIALLLIAPLFILLAAILRPQKGRPYMVTAFILLMLGTLSLFVSVETGEAAAELVDRSVDLDAVLKAHETMASQSQALFTALSVMFAAIIFLPYLFKRRDQRLYTTVFPLLFLVLYGIGSFSLVRTAHAGGRLVHQFGVQAMMPANADSQEPTLPK
jgi:uncharacterized membrane protein